MTETVLIVEDEPIIADDIEMILEKNGYAVSEIVDNSLDAIDHLGENKIDLVGQLRRLKDVGSGSICKIAFRIRRQKIKAAPPRTDPKAILIGSGAQAHDVVTRILNADVRDYILKWFCPQVQFIGSFIQTNP